MEIFSSDLCLLIEFIRVATSFIRSRKEEASKEKGRIEAGEATQRPSIPLPALYITRLSEPGGEGGLKVK